MLIYTAKSPWLHSPSTQKKLLGKFFSPVDPFPTAKYHYYKTQFYMKQLSTAVSALVYSDPRCRSWLAERQLHVVPTGRGGLGTLIVEFTSESQQLDFCLRFSEFCTQR
jgi:hypothetical protein